ncbi:Crp/Fnr family transcriptional regulator [Rhizobium alvei]|uniref:Crp/Fnr family transcriptional regulator n=1 Tax=Rhizobium alvei TaxID=1132659 RepID=A0ABT8YJ57_9HYPH|nr:Crp/Fnr family transcriptional regulator [Rhizobium alvei]MDO6963368.1 Crp/Fnr family transcriptional regulator [Rhizobium alvei]
MQGEANETYTNMVHGVVKLTKYMADGRQQIVSLKFAPSLVGKCAHRESAVSALTATEAQVCSFPRDVLEMIASKSPAVETRMHQQALMELDQAREWMLALGRKNAQEKLATFLVMVARSNSRNSQMRQQFQLPLNRTEIADFLGLTIETVSRQLTRLRQSNVISLRDSRHVTINDSRALELMSDHSLAQTLSH